MSVILYNFVMLKPDRKLIRQIIHKNCSDLSLAIRILRNLIRRLVIKLGDFGMHFERFPQERLRQKSNFFIKRVDRKKCLCDGHLFLQFLTSQELRFGGSSIMDPTVQWSP